MVHSYCLHYLHIIITSQSEEYCNWTDWECFSADHVGKSRWRCWSGPRTLFLVICCSAPGKAAGRWGICKNGAYIREISTRDLRLTSRFHSEFIPVKFMSLIPNSSGNEHVSEGSINRDVLISQWETALPSSSVRNLISTVWSWVGGCFIVKYSDEGGKPVLREP